MAIDLFSIGKFTIHGYGLMIALGFLAALMYGTWQCKKKGYNDDLFFNLAISCSIGLCAFVLLCQVFDLIDIKLLWKNFVEKIKFRINII